MTRMGLNVSVSRSYQIALYLLLLFFFTSLGSSRGLWKKCMLDCMGKPHNVRMNFKSGCLKGGSESMLCTLIL